MSIDRYLEQLMEDIRQASNKKEEQKNKKSLSATSEAIQHIAEVENYLHGEQYPLSSLVGIDTVQLPPPEKLTESQKGTAFSGT